MLARIYDEMLDSVEHLDRDTKAKVIYAYVDYQITWNLPPKEDTIVYSMLMAKKLDLDATIKDIQASIDNWKKGWRPDKNWNNSQKPKTNLKQPKDNLSKTWDKRQENREIKEIKESEFELFRKEFPHARKWKKQDSYNYFKQQDADKVMQQVAILKWNIKAWLQDPKYIPACERWIRDFTEINEDVIKQDLIKICKWHLNCGWDIKQRATELKQTFGEQQINEIVKAVQQKDSPKNLFLNQN